MREVVLEPGWLEQEFRAAELEIASWPKSMRDQTPVARARADANIGTHPMRESRYRLVPVEPTEEMLAMGARWSLADLNSQDLRDAWSAMLAAAPDSTQDVALIELARQTAATKVGACAHETRSGCTAPDGCQCREIARAVLALWGGRT